MKKELVKVDDVADMIGVTVNTLQRRAWRKANECPLRKVGSKLFAFPDEIESWLRSRNVA